MLFLGEGGGGTTDGRFGYCEFEIKKEREKLVNILVRV